MNDHVDRTALALATLADSRDDFFAKRSGLAAEETAGLGWLRERFDTVESDIIRSTAEIKAFASAVKASEAVALIVHLPIWADPILTIKLQNFIDLPLLLLGNDRPDTSSLVGILGAGGALDQIGRQHWRLFESGSAKARGQVTAFVRAAAARHRLRGQTLGLFGGRSLGIFTAVADPAQWQRLFGVDIEMVDQLEIMSMAEALPPAEVGRHLTWLQNSIGSVTYGGNFGSAGFERQVRSYLATRRLVSQHGFDFVGVKCQRELSDGYASQCVAHMLSNGDLDADGTKRPLVHACESDADGALTMQILHLLSEGQPTALLDIRWLNPESGLWTLANCGAMAAAFFATPQDPTGLGQVQAVPHVFGEGGGGAFTATVAPQKVTLARLCRQDGDYRLVIVPGDTLPMTAEQSSATTRAFPQALVKMNAGTDFLAQFGSNHIHMVAGDYTAELVTFCQLIGIPWQLWSE
jgi:L-fucose/D-arabinose isomerase